MKCYGTLRNAGRSSAILEQGHIIRTYINLGKIFGFISLDQVLHPVVAFSKRYSKSSFFLFFSLERRVILDYEQPLCKYLLDAIILLDVPCSNLNGTDIESEC
jgi:hypothetical protein